MLKKLNSINFNIIQFSILNLKYAASLLLLIASFFEEKKELMVKGEKGQCWICIVAYMAKSNIRKKRTLLAIFFQSDSYNMRNSKDIIAELRKCCFERGHACRFQGDIVNIVWE